MFKSKKNDEVTELTSLLFLIHRIDFGAVLCVAFKARQVLSTPIKIAILVQFHKQM